MSEANSYRVVNGKMIPIDGTGPIARREEGSELRRRRMIQREAEKKLTQMMREIHHYGHMLYMSDGEIRVALATMKQTIGRELATRYSERYETSEQ